MSDSHNPLDDLPQITAREIAVREADADLSGFLIELRKKHDLTRAEMITLLLGAATARARWIIVEERRK